MNTRQIEPPTPKNVLLTGPPGCGKTTVVCRVVEGLGRSIRAAGFYTREIRRQGARLGFEAIGLGTTTCVLAHVDSRSRIRVGRYGVELAAFESLVRAELEKPLQEADLVVIDEIGKMECSSGLFVELAQRVLDSPVPVLATIAAKGGGFIAEVKGWPDVQLIRVSAANRDQLPGELVERIRQAISPNRPAAS